MSQARPYNRDSLERALVHHGVDYIRPGTNRPKWYVYVNGGLDLIDREVYVFLAGFKRAADKVVTTTTRRREPERVAESFGNECSR